MKSTSSLRSADSAARAWAQYRSTFHRNDSADALHLIIKGRFALPFQVR